MNFLHGMKIPVRCEECLAWHTSFKLGGPAEVFAMPRTHDEAARAIARAKEVEATVRILGGGTNVLVGDNGLSGLVLNLGRDAFKSIKVRGNKMLVGAGASLASLVSAATDSSLSGVEGLVGIPGTLGGALVMNAGGNTGSIGEVVEAVHILDENLKRQTLRGKEIEWAYRSSGLEKHSLILGCEVKLEKGELDKISDTMADILEKKRTSQPYALPSAGCVFRNPDDGLSAGALVEELGLKGTLSGGAQVSEEHANFIVNLNGAKSDDIRTLIETIKTRVKEEKGIDLELEIRIWEDDRTKTTTYKGANKKSRRRRPHGRNRRRK